jgi:hypothetical protein
MLFDYFVVDPIHSLAIAQSQVPRFIMVSLLWTFVGWVVGTV